MKAAIIGYYRSGAKVEIIANITGFTVFEVEAVIKERLPKGW